MMDFGVVFNNMDYLMQGLRVTDGLALISIAGSMVLGTMLGILRYSEIPVIKQVSALFIEFTRSIPLIMYIIFVYLVVSPYLQAQNMFSKIIGISSLEMQAACIALILFTSAYVAEIIRGGLKSIESGHVDAAKSLGLSYFQRLVYVILPLAVSRMTPALVSQFVSLTKDTSLASVIGLIELTRSGEIIYERTHNELEILIFIAFVYFVICFSLSLLSKGLESEKFKFQSLNKTVRNL